MAFSIHITSSPFTCGLTYAFFWWGLFALYCIAHQLNRIRVYYIRSQRIAGDDKKVVTDLRGHRLLASFDRVVRIPFVTEMIPIKHVLGIFVFIIINLLFIFFAPFKMPDGVGYILPPINSMDRRCVFVGIVNCGFVFFLAQRNSILPKMSGLTFEELIPFHRIVARIGLLEFIPHWVYHLWQGYEYRFFVGIFQSPEETSGTLAMIGFVLMFITSIGYIRRNFFEIFYYCHITFMLMGTISACYHQTVAFAFFIPALILWFVDRIVRFYKSWVVKTSSVRVDQVVSCSDAHDGVVRILFENEGLTGFKAGQYAFVSIAKNGRKLWEYVNWHPFTVSEVFHVSNNNSKKTYVDSGVEECTAESTAPTITAVNTMDETKTKSSTPDSLLQVESVSEPFRRATALPGNNGDSKVVGSFHIKALGNMTRDLLKSAAANEELKIRVDGPYGPTLKYQDYQVASLFATGIGITPALAIIKDIVDKRSNGVRTMAIEQVYLSWAIRTTDEIAPFKDMFLYWNEKISSSVQPIQLTADVYVTRMNEGHDLFKELPGFNLFYGERPNIGVEMAKVKNIHDNCRVWVHACGASTFTRTVINEAVRHKFDAYNETFEF